MKDLLNMNPLYGEQFRTLMTLTGAIDLNDLSRLVDAAAALTSANEGALQELLETLDVPQRCGGWAGAVWGWGRSCCACRGLHSRTALHSPRVRTCAPIKSLFLNTTT